MLRQGKDRPAGRSNIPKHLPGQLVLVKVCIHVASHVDYRNKVMFVGISYTSEQEVEICKEAVSRPVMVNDVGNIGESCFA